MPTVYEQLQEYRAQQAKNTAALLAKHPSVNVFSHPKTSDFFKEMMQRWQLSQNSHVFASSKE